MARTEGIGEEGELADFWKDSEYIRITTIRALRKEVKLLTTRLRPAGTGYLHTAIDVLNSRIDELIGEAIDENRDQGRDLASKLFDEDVYDGYEEHTEAMEQSRLRAIQDKAAGRGLSDRSQFLQTMKQKHGQAVMTTSEMLQEELEPLPDEKPNAVRDAYLHSSKQKDDVKHTEEYYTSKDRNRNSMTALEAEALGS